MVHGPWSLVPFCSATVGGALGCGVLKSRSFKAGAAVCAFFTNVDVWGLFGWLLVERGSKALFSLDSRFRGNDCAIVFSLISVFSVPFSALRVSVLCFPFSVFRSPLSVLGP